MLLVSVLLGYGVKLEIKYSFIKCTCVGNYLVKRSDSTFRIFKLRTKLVVYDHLRYDDEQHEQEWIQT